MGPKGNTSIDYGKWNGILTCGNMGVSQYKFCDFRLKTLNGKYQITGREWRKGRIDGSGTYSKLSEKEVKITSGPLRGYKLKFSTEYSSGKQGKVFLYLGGEVITTLDPDYRYNFNNHNVN